MRNIKIGGDAKMCLKNELRLHEYQKYCMDKIIDNDSIGLF